MPAKKDPRLAVYTADQLRILDDVVTWQAMAEKHGVDANTLSVWFGRTHRRIGAGPHNLRSLAARPDHRPPLFLASVVDPWLKLEAKT